MKIILCGIIPFLTAFIGYFLSNKYSERKEFFEDFDCFHKILKTEISFTKRTIYEILKGNRENSDFLDLIQRFLNGNTEYCLKYLKKEEHDFVKKYFENLGVLDKVSQLDYINSLNDRIQKMVTDSQNEQKKYRPLYIKLGFLFGLVIFILLI